MAGIELDVTDDEFYCSSASVSENGFSEDDQDEEDALHYMFEPLKRICQARLNVKANLRLLLKSPPPNSTHAESFIGVLVC